MIKQPLFGQDSSPHVTSMFISAIATLVCWIIFCILCVVIKFKPKLPEYQEIQIVLDSTPVVERSVEEQSMSDMQQSAVPEPVEGPAVEEMSAVELPKPVENPVAEAKVEAPKKEAAPAKPKTTTQPKTQKEYTKVSEPETYGTFLGDEIDFGIKKPSSSSPDWNEIDFKDNESSQQSSEPGKVIGAESGYSGVQGFGTTDDGGSRSSGTNQDKKDTPTPSEETLKQLKTIRTAYSKRTGDVDSTVTAETTKSNGYVNMKMTDGSTRALLDPLTPSIKLSDEAAALIDNKRVVTISIEVTKTGYVPRSEITINPQSMLPEMVRNEIYDQLCKWVFESASTSSKATFEFTVERK